MTAPGAEGIINKRTFYASIPIRVLIGPLAQTPANQDEA